MKKLLCITLFILLIWGCCNGGNGRDNLFTFTILQTSDIHHHASGYGPFADYTPYDTNDSDGVLGGYSRLATVVLDAIEEQSAKGIPVLLFDSGDFLMGTVYDLTAEDPIGLKFFTLMEYDAVTFGNHEFDWGPDGLAILINNALNSATLPFKTPIVASNMIMNDLEDGDDNLEALVDAGLILKEKIIELPYGIRIGVLGLLGPDAEEKSPIAKPITFNHEFSYIQQLVDDLRTNQGADIVVALSHGGIYETGNGDDEELANNVSGVDIIASGHYHTATHTPFKIKDTMIFSPGKYGEYVSRLDVTYNASEGRVVNYSFSLIPIDDNIKGNSVVQQMIESYHENMNLALDPLSLRSPISKTGFYLDEPFACEESGLGNLTADAIRTIASLLVFEGSNYHPGSVDPTPFSLSVVPNGSIRSSLQPGKTEIITFTDIYNVLPIGISPDTGQRLPGYPMISLYITAPEIRNVCEVSISIAPQMDSDYFLNLSGIRFEYDDSASPFKRVLRVYLCDDPLPEEFLGSGDAFSASCETELNLTDPNTLYRAAVNLYALQMLKIVSDMGLSIVPKDSHGIPLDLSNPLEYMQYRIDSDNSEDGMQELKEWMALLEFLRQYFPASSEGIPSSIYGADGIAMGRMKNLAQ